MVLFAALTAFLCACGSERTPLISERTPLIKDDINADHVQSYFLKGIKSYESGDYMDAAELLKYAIMNGLKSKKDRVIAHKYLAFINCFTAHEVLCRSEFRKAFEIDPDFELEPEEDGHPIWTPIYLDVKRDFAHSNPRQ